jgi:hypothetical protein
VKGWLLGLGLLALVAGGGLLAARFLLGGGFERWRAERDVASRGIEATEPIDVDGLWTMKLPRGWRRDSIRERLGVLDQPDTGLRSWNPDHAEAHFALGRYTEIGGRRVGAQATVRVRLPDGAPIPVGRGDDGAAGVSWRVHAEDPDGVTYLPAYATPETLAAEVWLLHDAPARGVQVELETKASIYRLDEAIAVARALAWHVAPNRPALSALAREARERQALAEDAIQRSQAVVRAHFGIGAIPDAWDEVAVLADGSFVQSSRRSLKILYRLGVLPGTPTAAPATGIEEFWRHAGGAARADSPAGTEVDRIVGVLPDVGGGLGLIPRLHTEPRRYLDATNALTRALRPTLDGRPVPVYRVGEFAWTETDAIGAWLDQTRALRAAVDARKVSWAVPDP